MSKTTMNLQDSFLNQVRKDSVDVKIILIDGTILYGVVRGFDNFTIILTSKESQHLIYKHAIAQLISRRNANRREPASDKSAKKAGFNTIDMSKVNIGK